MMRCCALEKYALLPNKMNVWRMSPHAPVQRKLPQGRDHIMKQPAAYSEQAPMSTAFAFQRLSRAACIILAPLSITLYLVTWGGNQRAPLIDAAMAVPTGNTLHFIGAIAASFFLPLGYLGMSL